MRTFLFLFVLAVAANVCNAQWIQTNGPYGGSVAAIYTTGGPVFASTSRDLPSGVYCSTNSGTSWYESGTGLPSGFVNTFASDGTNYFAGELHGGVYRSNNSGASWVSVSLNSPQGIVCLFYGNSTLFAGTATSGAYRSTNAGASWLQVNTGLNENWVNAFCYNSPNMFVGTSHGVYYSTNNGTNWILSLNNRWVNDLIVLSNGYVLAATDVYGVYRSIDNGFTWSQANTGLGNLNANDLEYASGLFVTAGGGLYQSTNNGSSWSWFSPPSEIRDTSASKLASGGTGPRLYVGFNQGIYSTPRNILPTLWGRSCTGISGHGYLAITADAAGIFVGTYNENGGVFRSTNSGSTWVSLNNVAFPYLQVSQLFLGEHGLYARVPGGVYRSLDRGDTWFPSGTGLPNVSVVQFAETGGYLFASLSTNRLYRSSDGSLWSSADLGLTGINGSLVVSENNLYAGTSSGAYRSTNNGTTWTTAGLSGLNPQVLVAYESKVFAQAGALGYWISTNYGATWDSINGGIPATYRNSYAARMICYRRNVFLAVYPQAGTQGAVLHLKHNAPSWTMVNQGIAFQQLWSLGTGGQNLYLGARFAPVLRRSFVEMIPWIAVTGPLAGDTMNVGSAQAVSWNSGNTTGNVNIKLSTDGGSQWPYTIVANTPNDGVEAFVVPNYQSQNCRIKVVSVSDDSTYGVNPGNFVIRQVNAVNEAPHIPLSFGVGQNYPNPFNPSTTINYQLPTNSHVTLRVFDVLGSEVATLVNGVEEPGYKLVQWDASGVASGVYLYRFQTGNFVDVKKLLLLK